MFKFLKGLFTPTKAKVPDELDLAMEKARERQYYNRYSTMPSKVKETKPIKAKREDTIVEDIVEAIVINHIVDSVFDSSSSDSSSSDSSNSDWGGDGGGFSGGGSSGDW